MDGHQRPIGPTPGALSVPGMGGPGSGMTNIPRGAIPKNSGLKDWLGWQWAGGLGLGPYGYALHPLVGLGTQQNLLLNQQWGWPGWGTHYEYATNAPKGRD